MLGKSIVLLALVFSVACADKKYLESADGGGGGRNQKVTARAQFANGYWVTYEWEERPTIKNGKKTFGSFIFKTFRPNLADGSPVLIDLPGEHSVVLWMSSMNHGSSPVDVKQIDVGTYRASKVFFTMDGEWDLRFLIKNGNVSDQAILTIIFKY